MWGTLTTTLSNHKLKQNDEIKTTAVASSQGTQDQTHQLRAEGSHNLQQNFPQHLLHLHTTYLLWLQCTTWHQQTSCQRHHRRKKERTFLSHCNNTAKVSELLFVAVCSALCHAVVLFIMCSGRLLLGLSNRHVCAG